MTKFLLDTDVLIDIQRGYQPAERWFFGLSEIPSIAGFVAMELIQNSQNKQRLQSTQKLLSPLPIIWPTESDCARALSDFTAYHLSHSVGLIDALIAACAVGQNATLYTFNTKHYQIISRLKIEQPYSRE